MSQAHVKSITPKQAWEMLQNDPRTVLIDVRSNMEFLFVGHPKGAINIAWIDEPDWIVNPHFVAEVRKVVLGGASCIDDAGCAPIILICRSGKRSLVAGELLVKQGMSEIYNVVEGFEGDLDETHHRSTLGGWRYHDLPWEQC